VGTRLTRPEKLTSLVNPRIKSAVQLREQKVRRETGRFGIEGSRELGRALAAGFDPIELYVCPNKLSKRAQRLLIEAKHLLAQCASFEVTAEVFGKLAVREASDGIFAVCRARKKTLKDIELPAFPLILAMQGVEKPGNIGAMLRTADGAGVDAVVLIDPVCDVFNPNVIRSSLGAVFQAQVVSATTAEFLEFCKTLDLQIVAAIIQDDSVRYTAINYRAGTAIVMGSEAEGLDDAWRDVGVFRVQIPMLGVIDSLNVATAASVIMYEAVRQRFSL
jgi:RNA methyltransferase, TrmH family